MDGTTRSKGSITQSPNSSTTSPGGENLWRAHRRHMVDRSFWALGFIIMIVASVFVKLHPAPYPIDLQTTETLQSFHLWAWVNTVIAFISSLNDPIPSIIALAVWLIGLSMFRWFKQALFLVLGSAASDGFDGLVRLFVDRPRPMYTPQTPIHVYMPEPFKSYPSGHTEHDVVYYGFLLYLSFTKPVREWRYRWVLLPFQIFAIYDIIAIGYSRILEGDHWLTDVLGGYLEGALELFFFIFLFRFTITWYAKHRAKRSVEKAIQAR